MKSIVVTIRESEHMPQTGEFYPLTVGGITRYHRIVGHSPFEEDATGLGVGILQGRLDLADEGIVADPDAPFPHLDPWDEMGYARPVASDGAQGDGVN